jgi:peptide/nickel transport system substrate-binding protein
MDQSRDELLYADVKGKNPFKDRRVRLAIYQALDTDALNRVSCAGSRFQPRSSCPTRSGRHSTRAQQALPYDVEKAKKLLAEAGYAKGFSTQIDCQNVRENVCTAIAGMLARIGINVKVNSLQNARYFAKGQSRDTSFYSSGWGGQNTGRDVPLAAAPALTQREGRRRLQLGRLQGREDGRPHRPGEGRDGQGEAPGAHQRRAEDPARAGLPRADPSPDGAWASRANVELANRPDSWLESAG